MPQLPEEVLSTAAGGIKVISYNVLNEAYATHQMYPYCPTWALDWKHRKNQVRCRWISTVATDEWLMCRC